MASSASAAAGIEHPENPSRRDFLYIATAAMGAVAAGAALVPLIDQMNPDASTLAAGGPIDIDISKLQAGQNIIVRWRPRPVFILNRPPNLLAKLTSPQLLERLADPDSRVVQQPDYARNSDRSI